MAQPDDGLPTSRQRRGKDQHYISHRGYHLPARWALLCSMAVVKVWLQVHQKWSNDTYGQRAELGTSADPSNITIYLETFDGDTLVNNLRGITWPTSDGSVTISMSEQPPHGYARPPKRQKTLDLAAGSSLPQELMEVGHLRHKQAYPAAQQRHSGVTSILHSRIYPTFIHHLQLAKRYQNAIQHAIFPCQQGVVSWCWCWYWCRGDIGDSCLPPHRLLLLLSI